MIFAEYEGQRIKASPNSIAICPSCKNKVISKCGEIKIWHWAHESNIDCDIWGEPESEWHLSWKNNFPKECSEIILGNHRADIRCKIQNTFSGFEYGTSVVIELQNSPISPSEIKERENFYRCFGSMIWIFNGEKFANNLILKKDVTGGSKGYRTFRWKWYPKIFEFITYPCFIDFPQIDKLFRIKKIHSSGKYVGGWGHFIEKKQFLINYGGLIHNGM